MKKIIFLLLIITTSFVLCGCVSTAEDNGISINSRISEAYESNNIIYLQGDWPGYATLKELVDACDYIIIGKVEKVLPTIREKENPNLPYFANYTPSQVLIEKIMVGSKSEGEYIYIRQRGGTFMGISENNKEETITEVAEGIVLLEEGAEYLMFIQGENNAMRGIEYPYFLTTPTVSYPQIVNGKLVTRENNNLFENGTSLDEAIHMIEACLSTPEATE